MVTIENCGTTRMVTDGDIVWWETADGEQLGSTWLLSEAAEWQQETYRARTQGPVGAP